MTIQLRFIRKRGNDMKLHLKAPITTQLHNPSAKRATMVIRAVLSVAIFAYFPGTMVARADCSVIRGKAVVNADTCGCSGGDCGTIRYLFGNQPYCDDALPGESGRTGCDSVTQAVGTMSRCNSAPNYFALMAWAGSFTLCTWACVTAVTNPLSFWKCLGCIAINSGSPIFLACNFVICSRGDSWTDIMEGVATGLTGDKCEGSGGW